MASREAASTKGKRSSGEFPVDPTGGSQASVLPETKEASGKFAADEPSADKSVPKQTAQEKSGKFASDTKTDTSELKRSKPCSDGDRAVIVCGWPEHSATQVAVQCRNAGYRIIPFGFALQEESGVTFQPEFIPKELDDEIIRLIPSSRLDLFKAEVEKLESKPAFLGVVDTSPDASERARCFAELGLPFVIRPSDGKRADSAEVAAKTSQKVPAVLLERSNMAVGVLEDALVQSAKRFRGILKDYDVHLRRSSAALNSLLSPKVVDALHDLTERQLSDKELFDDASKHPLPAEAESVEELVLENKSSLVKISLTRKEPADDEEFARISVQALQFLQKRAETGLQGGVFGLCDVLSEQASASS